LDLEAITRAISIQSSTINLGDTFREHARQSIIRAIGKYFGRLNNAAVYINREGPFFRCTVNIQMGSLKTMSAEFQHDDCYAAFNNALAKVEKQLRRAKRELLEDKATRTDKDMMLREGLRSSPTM
jgi:ribosomal subunit interface protein